MPETANNSAQANTGAQAGENTQTNTNTPANTQNAAQGENNAAQDNNLSNIEQLIQKAVDRATNKLGNENKKLRDQIEGLKKEKLSDDELKQLEMKEKEAEIAEREQRLLEKENRLLAIKAIKEIGLDDGGKDSLELVDFVMANDEATIKERVRSFKGLVDRFVKAEVDKTFKTNGRTPTKSNATENTENKQDSVAARLGKSTAAANKAAISTLEYYTGGKKR